MKTTCYQIIATVVDFAWGDLPDVDNQFQMKWDLVHLHDGAGEIELGA